MARLRDIKRVLINVGPFEFTKRLIREILTDNIFVWASALAYSWLFACFPFIIFLMSLLPYLPEQTKFKADEQISTAIATLPKPAADVIRANLNSLLRNAHTGLLSTAIGIAIFAASGGMNMTMAGLDKCYDVVKARAFWKQRILAILLTVVVAAIILAVLILLPIGNAVEKYILTHEKFGLSKQMILIFSISRHCLAIFLMLCVLAILYYFGPNVKQRFHLLTPGSIFTISVWLFLGVTFKFYIERFGKYDQTYGTVAGVAVLLLFFYIDAVVLLIGAEINSEIDFALGIPRGATDFRNIPNEAADH